MWWSQPDAQARPWRSVYRRGPQGRSFHWYETGQEHPLKLVMLHGIMAHAMAFRHIVEPLSTRAHLIVPDLPGHGHDDTFRAQDPSVAGLTDWLRGLLDALALPQVHLLGHSLGGLAAFLAAQEAARFPELQSLTLISPGLRMGSFSKALSAPVMRLIPERVIHTFVRPAGVRLVEPLQWPHAARMAREELRRYIAPMREPERFRFMYAIMREVRAHPDRLTDPHTIALPTLIIWGAQDWMLPVWTAGQLTRAMPNARVQVLTRAGHSPIEDQPHEVVRRVIQFLDDL